MFLQNKTTAFTAINTLALGFAHPAQQPQRKQRLKRRVVMHQQKQRET
jgi:hypothetical protein